MVDWRSTGGKKKADLEMNLIFDGEDVQNDTWAADLGKMMRRQRGGPALSRAGTV